MSNFNYYTYGVSIISDIELPLPINASQESAHAITIKHADVNAEGIESPQASALHYQCKPKVLWLEIPNIARFLILDGAEIHYQSAANVDAKTLALQLVNSCLSAALHQSGMTVLHASAAVIEGKCVVFAGPSCQGKSLLAAALYKQGHTIVSDNLCVIDENGLLHPGPPNLAIWRDCFRVLEVQANSLKALRPGLQKYSFPVENSFCAKAQAIDAFYLLHNHNKEDSLITEAVGMDKIMPLRSQVHRLQYLEGLGLMSCVSKNLMKLANHARVVHFTRPQRLKVAKWVELVENDVTAPSTAHNLEAEHA